VLTGCDREQASSFAMLRLMRANGTKNAFTTRRCHGLKMMTMNPALPILRKKEISCFLKTMEYGRNDLSRITGKIAWYHGVR
jgi:hypothetical protein